VKSNPHRNENPKQRNKKLTQHLSTKQPTTHAARSLPESMIENASKVAPKADAASPNAFNRKMRLSVISVRGVRRDE